jgi:hypothetical protein
MMENETLAPTDLRDYFKANGWSILTEALADRLYIFSHSKFPRRQITFPMDLSAPDYAEAVDTAIAKFSEITGRSASHVTTSIETIKDDVIGLRIFFDGNDTSLPLSFASILVQSTEKLLKAAACTVLRPRIHHPRLALTEANQLVNQSRFRQTERGSYLLKVACPLYGMEIQGSLGFDAPFVRQVTLTLNKALSQLTSAIEFDTINELVDDLKKNDKPALSANLCEAIHSMHDEQVNNSLDLKFDWSALRATPAWVNNRTIRIQRDYFSRIEEIRRELRSLELAQAETFIGTVEKLEGEMGSDGRRSGSVVLALLLPEEGETVRARTVLSPDDYHQADQAHMTNGAYIRVTGCLMPGRQPRHLARISLFEMLPQRMS